LRLDAKKVTFMGDTIGVGGQYQPNTKFSRVGIRELAVVAVHAMIGANPQGQAYTFTKLETQEEGQPCGLFTDQVAKANCHHEILRYCS
jgi:hypothetical protein